MKNISREFTEKRIKNMHDISFAIAAAICNRETFKDMEGMNHGKEVVLCGAGPSLSNYVPIKNALHVALNRALLYDKVKFDWLIADDWLGINFIQDEIVKYDCQKFFGRFSDDLSIRAIPKSFGYKCNAKWFYTDIFITSNGFDGKFVIDIDKMPLGGMPHIALEAMPILLFTHPDKIYLAGCDSTVGHFIEPDLGIETKERFKKDEEMVIANQKAIIDKWKTLKKFAEVYYPDVEIISINPVGLKGIFKDISNK